MYKTDLKTRERLVFEITSGGENNQERLFFFIIYGRYKD